MIVPLAGAVFLSAPLISPARASAEHGEVEGAPPAGAAQPGADEGASDAASRASSIARRTMSPFCPGRTLADCPSNYAAEWRQDIREMVARGMSASEIQAELSRRAGGDLSGIPNRDSSYALPIAIGLAAASVLAWVLLRLRKNRKTGDGADSTEAGVKAPEASEAPPVDDARLASELEAEDDE